MTDNSAESVLYCQICKRPCGGNCGEVRPRVLVLDHHNEGTQVFPLCGSLDCWMALGTNILKADGDRVVTVSLTVTVPPEKWKDFERIMAPSSPPV